MTNSEASEMKAWICEDGGVSGVSSSCGARGGFLPRHDEDLSPTSGTVQPKKGTDDQLQVGT